MPNRRPEYPQAILLVEDEQLVSLFMRDVLEDEGFQCLSTNTVDHARRWIEHVPIGAAILDVSVRGELVFPLAHLLVEKRTPFVFVTGYDRDVIPKEFDSTTYFQKPVDTEQLLGAIKRLIATADDLRNGPSTVGT